MNCHPVGYAVAGDSHPRGHLCTGQAHSTGVALGAPAPDGATLVGWRCSCTAYGQTRAREGAETGFWAPTDEDCLRSNLCHVMSCVFPASKGSVEIPFLKYGIGRKRRKPSMPSNIFVRSGIISNRPKTDCTSTMQPSTFDKQRKMWCAPTADNVNVSKN